MLLPLDHLIKKVREVFSSVLLLSTREILVAFTDQVLEDLGTNSILVILVLLLLVLVLLSDNLLCELLLRVLAGAETIGKLGDVALVAIGGILCARLKVGESCW